MSHSPAALLAILMAVPVLAVPPSAPAPAGFVAGTPATARWFGPGVMAGGGMSFTVTFDDPMGSLADVGAQIQSNLLAAAARWASFVQGTGDISIVVRPSDISTANCRSLTTGFVANRDGFNVFEQGWAYEVRTGEDPNGGDADIEVNIGVAYAHENLWFDPAPTVRSEPIPANRTDAVSVFLHELGHALAFNGWIDAGDGSLPGDYRSTTDELTVLDTVPQFNGPLTTARYGGTVPMTLNNWCHFGNSAPLPGSELISDLMNGVVFFYQTRYDITNLDLDLAEDVGVLIARGCGPADLGSQGGFASSDGVLDNNDFIAFITLFFAQNAAADKGQQGGLPGADGQFDNNDFIAFINYFFEGC